MIIASIYLTESIPIPKEREECERFVSKEEEKLKEQTDRHSLCNKQTNLTS